MIFKQPCLFQVADKVPFLQTDRNWIDIFHQLILFIIILGRWMLPKASGVTRDQLSQILLTFIGVGADILEFVTETMKVRTLITWMVCLDLTSGIRSALRAVRHYSYVGVLELESGSVCPGRIGHDKSTNENDRNLWFPGWLARHGKWHNAGLNT